MRYQAFVVRIQKGDDDQLQGQLSDPQTGERWAFRKSAELIHLLQNPPHRDKSTKKERHDA